MGRHTYQYAYSLPDSDYSTFDVFSAEGRKDIVRKRGSRVNREIELLSLVENVPGVIKRIKLSKISKESGLCMRKYEGDLSYLMRGKAARCAGNIKVPFTLHEILPQMVRLLTTFDIMHGMGFCHNDLKPQNIFYDEKENLYVGDFDLSRQYTTEDMERFRQAKQDYKNGVKRDYLSELSIRYHPGTFIYTSPEGLMFKDDLEVWEGPRYPVTDIWSLGCIFFEMLTLRVFNTSTFYMEEPGRFVYKKRWLDEEDPLELLDVFTEDMNIEGFSIYGDKWREKLAVRKKELFSPMKVVVSYQNATRDGKCKLGTEDRNNLTDLLNGMLDPNFLTRLSAKECLENPLFKDHLHISETMWKYYEEKKARTKTAE